MALAQVLNGVPTEIATQTVTFSDGVTTSIESVRLWTDAERAERGIFDIVETPAGPNEVVVTQALTFNGTSVVREITTAPRTVRPEEVVKERERRLALGFDFAFGDARGTHRIGTTPTDMIGWDEVTKATQAMIALGQGSSTLTIVTNTGPATITALEWQQILVAATQFRQPIWAKSFALQAMSPIPPDFASDARWA